MRRRLAALVLLLLAGCDAPVPEPQAAASSASVVRDACDAIVPRPSRVSVVVAPDDGDGRLLALLDGAQRSIDMTIYQLSSPRVIDALKAAATRGVQVRVIQDWREAIPGVLEALRAAGAVVHTSAPEFEHTHQKTVTVDARTSFVFSGNLDQRAFVRGRNYGVFDEDADDVADLEELFDADWVGREPDLRCTRLVVAPVNARSRVLAFIQSAKSTLDVEAMYITDRGVEAAILEARDRGALVRVLLNDPSHDIGNVAAVAARLGARGVLVRRSGPRFIHAKLLVADAAFAFVGSENFSRNALDRNREVGVIISSGDSDVSRIVETFASDWDSALPFTPPLVSAENATAISVESDP
jgi:cardiolipin synthase A/B